MMIKYSSDPLISWININSYCIQLLNYICFIFVTGVCPLDQFIYVVGGYDSINQLRTVERYDVETNQWEYISPMNSPRSALSVAVVNSKIFALGNFYFCIIFICIMYYFIII